MTLQLKYQDGFWPNTLALAYAVMGYVVGWLMLIQGTWWWLPGVLLLGHSMVIAAYLIHECAHNTLFKNNEHNAKLGKALAILVGANYGSYEGIRHKHFRHHVDRADVVAFDYRGFLEKHPMVKRLIQTAEWCYIPATDVLMHYFVLTAPWEFESYAKERIRVLRNIIIRGSLLLAVFLIAPWALLGYLLAYCLFLIVLRTMDMHQHTFEVFTNLSDPKKLKDNPFDRAYEQRNTFSNIISFRRPWLNWMVLNFGFHNAHHAKPNAPWYRLPAIHAELFGCHSEQEIPFNNILKNYHRYRVERVNNVDTGDIPIGDGDDKGMGFVGVYGVSFLTAL